MTTNTNSVQDKELVIEIDSVIESNIKKIELDGESGFYGTYRISDDDYKLNRALLDWHTEKVTQTQAEAVESTLNWRWACGCENPSLWFFEIEKNVRKAVCWNCKAEQFIEIITVHRPIEDLEAQGKEESK